MRQTLLQELPEPMVPSAFVFLEELPLTPHGKVDRRALPAPQASHEVEVALEKSPAEELLAGIWSALLRVSAIGPRDNFFDLGGHSLLATQVVSRVREVFGVELPLRALFETPTLAGLAARIQSGGPGLQAPPIVALPRDGEVRASFAQERLWFLDRFGTDRAAYNIPAAVRLEGRLDVPALAACLTEIVRRHESLRTTFVVTGGSKVLQVIAPPADADLPLPVVDLGGLPEAEVVRLAREEARRVFDLQRGPVLRAMLARLGEREYTLLLSVHHIVADGWSIGVLVRELSALYSAFVQGRPSPLPDLPVQYADFAAWQRAWLQGEVLETQLGWWRERLAGAPAVIELPADRPRPAVQSARGGRLGYALPAELSRGLQALVRSEGATLFMALLAGFQALLARTTGSEDLPVGTPIANRNRAEVEDLIGFFVNTLVMRGDLSGDPSFRELLARSREAALGAYAHQDMPFEKLVEELRPERDLSHSPLFQAMVILQNAPAETLELPDLTVVPVGTDSGTTKFDLRLALMQTPDGLAGSLVYNRDLFDVSTVERLGGYLENLLTAAVARPELPLSELPLLGEIERRQLLQWGDAQPAAAGRAVLHRLFEIQVSDRTAVTFAGEHLTYRELDARANRLAHALIAEGVRPGDLVGLRLERSLDMVVAVLGVLKAGGAYLPLDTTYPEERLAFAIEDSQVYVVVTQEWLGRAERHSPENPGVEVTPDFPAYVIYTSGSTGRPKGVVVTHANAARLFATTDAWFGFGPEDVWTLFHSYAFDFSVWELWGALLYGGRLVVVPYWVSRSPEAFYELVRDERVTVLNQTPSAFRQLIWAEQSILTSLGQVEPDLALRYVVFGGEALELASLAPWYERHAEDQPRLVNMYGITETTVHVTYRPLSRRDVEEARGSVIGVPIPDLSLRVLDRDLRLQPIGVPGEIHVGGEGLALGYLGRPELTAERFVPDPFGPAGARLYRSGDLVRYLADGDVEYLGRIDQQVKIRGFRIELGEIETALTSQPEIREAVVLAREDKPGDKRLVAYLVAESELPAGELRERLKAKLPEYMVPAAFMTLPALPLTANGKVDRKALPLPEAAQAQKRDRVAPRTALERFLAELWQGSLGLSEVGIEYDFFELGGNSISGAILINRLQETLNEIVQVVVIFDAPTVEHMAAYLIGNHAGAVARIWGEESLRGAAVSRRQVERVDEARVEQMRALVRPLPPLAQTGPKNPPAVFVLAPPRSGTTLMRVMLGGHPRLFAPPELELLSYNTLAERKATYSGRDAFWLEGLVRAVMEVRGCTAEETVETIAVWEDEDWTTKRAYGQLQDWLGQRILVDKTPSYALDPAILERAEEDFAEPLYVHLVRHPYGMIRSFEEAKLDQIFFRQEHPFERRELAELIWLVSQENILRFLEGIPSRRWYRVHFEELLREPEAVLRRLCGFLGLDFDPAMVRPYENKSQRMTDGIHAESRMLGDVKFHTHSGIDASTAERWKETYQEDFLGVPTAQMANTLGYELPAGRGAAIPRRAWKADELRPLSFAQERLWFLHQLEPESFAYNLSGAVRLAGSLDVAALSGTLAGIVRRHESLRTTFVEKDGQGWQAVAESAPLNLPLCDLSGLPAGEEEARRVAVAEARRIYDVARGPLARFTLLQLGEREHVVLIGMHHIVSDGWSLNVFVHELDALYRSLAAGEPAALPELPIQYSDFAAWQRQVLTDQVLGERLAWWTEKLSGAPQVVELPLDRPRPPVQSHRGAHEVATFGQGLGTRLEALSRRLGVTPFMTLMAGFAALLSRSGGQTDIVVGTPIANRGSAEVEDLIGFFANTLALHIDLSGEPTFRELTGRVREIALGAFAHQDVPFERLVSELRLERSLSYTPVFQTVLSLQNIPQSDLDMAGLTLSPLEIEIGRSQFDLSLFLFSLPDGGIRVWTEYVRDLFDAGTVRRLLGHFNRLLEGVVVEGGANTRLSDLPLMSREEREQVLHLWNDTATRYPREATIHGLFEEQARRAPGTLAVVGEGEEVTYSKLNRRAERLAARLLAAGVQPDEAVGLCAERSADMIAALLGILKAGGAYVPLDPAYPRERLAAMLSDAGARIVVVQEGLEDVLPWDGTVRLPLHSEDGGELPVRPAADPEQLAYILFTSGSTGRPKGVAVSHRNVVRLVRETDFARFGPDEVFLQFAPVSFDASTLEIWGPLLNGGRLVLFPPGPPDLRQLGNILERHGVTTLWLTAGLFHQMVEAHPESLRSIRQLAAGGDVLSPVHVRRALAGLPGLTLINGYGPTEGTTFTCCHVMRSEADLGPGTVPIGRPIANTRVYLLDAMFQPVPVGVVGQLYAAGDGLARGYAGRPDLTAERFVPDPVSGEAGTRLYATGDLARWRPSGEIEFLGRADSQVKIRGFRIEPGEIEAVLAEHPEVETPLVIVCEDVAGDRRLVAYVVPVAGRSPEPAALRAWVEEWLPSYMVPAAFVLLSDFPLGATGKVDRHALPAPVRERSEPERLGERSAVEELLAGIWCDLLGISSVAPHESFFELGGHSLLATRMISRIRAVLDLELPLRAVFEEPTLAGLAAMAERARRGNAGMPPLVKVQRSGPLPTSFSQQRLWFLDRLEPGSIAYNLPRAVRLEGPVDVAALAGALSGIVSRHESLRTHFVEKDGEPWQVIAEAVPLPLPVFDLASLPAAAREQEARRVSAAEARRPFDLARGPLLRCELLRLGEREHVLLAGMHHIVSDGWSMGIFVRELGDLYRGLVSREPARLPELPIQYADFATWQRQWLRGEVMEERLAWWTMQLAGAPQVVDLPLDRPRPPIQSYDGGRAHLTIGRDLEERLDAVARRLGVTPFMVLLAAFATLLRRYGSQADIVMGTPIANRERAELETLIGMFVNTLALRVDLSGDPDVAGLARRVREVALGAFSYQDVPFERLVEELQPERSLSHAPVFQVVLALQNLPEADLDLGEVTLSRLPIDGGAAQVDLALFLIPSAQYGMLARMDYASYLFDPDTVERLLGHFHRLLEGVTAEGADGLRISELSLLSREEREQVVREWNRTAAEIPDGPVHRSFRQWAERRPDALAVSWSGGRLSYGELARRVERLACRLRERGVGPETVVALCFERSPELITATLAVLAAGGAYLPIDPAQPAERLEWILRDSAAALLLMPETLAGMEEGMEEMHAREEGFVPVSAAPDDLAYVIYTSGSTGMPKGAELRHRGLSGMMAWNRRYHGIGPEDRNTFLGGPGFDASVWELWGALTSGASLHIPSPELIPAPAALLRWMAAEGITVSFLPTPLAEAAMAERLPEGLALRVLIVAGDRLVRRPAPDAPFTLFNLYGPTENTVTATASRVAPFGDRAPDIGTPVDNTRVYIVDRFLWPVPVGAPGELCLAGEGLARSYRFRPQLTADRFMPDPFGGTGERLYRTGDLARWRPDGRIEFLGRVDFQVKIRGFRIELGEVETALTRQPGVESAVVLAREDDGEKRLVAYVVGPAGGTSAEELRRGLQRTLPEPMLPSAFVFLEAFPLTQHGKVDRRALPAPERSQHGTGADFVPPRTPLEEEIAQVWRDVLKVDRIGVSDTFWELGGHSLLATRVLSRIEELFEIDLPLQTLFALPSLGEFAAIVGQRALVREEGEDIDAALAELNEMSEDEIRALIEQEARELEEMG
ncbi:MAG TPA: amino acid adenylation domain-containing protein [Thermoanaerobaculia bacterium]|nr:amino acid adenylation domain-containing protein [Thermoanaerobaculia bacterium]